MSVVESSMDLCLALCSLSLALGKGGNPHDMEVEGVHQQIVESPAIKYNLVKAL